MRYLKMLGVVAVVAAGLMAFTGVASATTLTSPKGTTYTGTIHAESEGIALEGTFVTATCNLGTFHGTIESHGPSVTSKIKLSGGGYALCGFQHYVLKSGFLEIHTDSSTADGHGTVTSTGMEITLASSVGHCVFTTSNTDLGTITGSDTGNAVWDTNGAVIPRTSGSFFCGSSGTLTGRFTFTTPSTLSVD